MQLVTGPGTVTYMSKPTYTIEQDAPTNIIGTATDHYTAIYQAHEAHRNNPDTIIKVRYGTETIYSTDTDTYDENDQPNTIPDWPEMDNDDDGAAWATYVAARTAYQQANK